MRPWPFVQPCSLGFCALLGGALVLQVASGAQLPPERGKGGAALLGAFSPIMDAARHSVVLLRVEDVNAALGAVIDAKGLVVTKASELGQGALSCRLSSGNTVPARLLVVDEDNDLALVQVEADGLKPIVWADDESALGRWAITPGVESRPEAVGIISAAPRRILHKRAYIGVLPDYRASKARIQEVTPGMGADQAGLQPGDIILRVNGEPVENGEALVSILRTFREGQIVQLRVQRGDEELDVDVPLMSMREDQSRGSAGRQERMNRLGGEISRRAEGFQLAIQHDSVLQPWQCGGPLLNLEGEAFGLNIARAGRIASYALPASLVQQLVAQLREQIKQPVHQDEPAVR